MSAAIGWIGMKFDTDMPDPQRINCNDFDPLTSHLMVSVCQNFNLSMVDDKISARLTTFPSASVFSAN